MLYVSFRPTLLHSHSRSTGACLTLSYSAFSLLFRFLSSASDPLLATQPSVSSVPLIHISASQQLPCFSHSAFAFRLFHLPFHPVSRASLQISVLGSRLFPFVLPSFAPTAVPLVLTLHLFRAFCLTVPFLSSVPALGCDYSAFCNFFSLHPCFPMQRFHRFPFIRFLSRLLPCVSSGFGTQPAVLPFSGIRFASQRLLSIPRHAFRFSRSP